MFKSKYTGIRNDRIQYSLTGTEMLRQYLTDQLDTVQLAAACSMPTGCALVSRTEQEANLKVTLHVEHPYGRERILQLPLIPEAWKKIANGNFEPVYSELSKLALRILIDHPLFFHTRVSQFKQFYLYTFSKETRWILRECVDAYVEDRPNDAPMNDIFRREDVCLMLYRREKDFLLSCISDEREVLIRVCQEEDLFNRAESLESVLWRFFNQYMLETYEIKLSSTMLYRLGSRLRVEK